MLHLSATFHMLLQARLAPGLRCGLGIDRLYQALSRFCDEKRLLLLEYRVVALVAVDKVKGAYIVATEETGSGVGDLWST